MFKHAAISRGPVLTKGKEFHTGVTWGRGKGANTTPHYFFNQGIFYLFTELKNDQ
jgi:hypothetical protein